MSVYLHDIPLPEALARLESALRDADLWRVLDLETIPLDENALGRTLAEPVWAKTSEFKGADAVTAASIDLGHHVYTWDLKDLSGTTVKPGEYKILVEVSFGPSMQYQRAEAMLTIEKVDSRVLVQEGNLIHYLEVQYLR